MLQTGCMSDDPSPDVDDEAPDGPGAGGEAPMPSRSRPEASAGPTTPAGWYPDGSGGQRWWNGTSWTEHVAPAAQRSALDNTDSKTIATLIHVGGIFFGFIPALVIYLVKQDDPFVRHHSAQALNFEITLVIAYFVCFILFFVLIGFLLIFVVLIGSFVLHIVAAVAANRGEYFRYPFTLQLVS